MTIQSSGSEWKQWDLHFHTPSSYDYDDNSVTNEDIIDAMEKSDISAFAVTDHHEIDIQRYKELSALGQAKGITVLPGIEFLSDSRGSDPIHFIAIFSEDSDIDWIWGELQHRTELKKIHNEKKKHNEVYCDLKNTVEIVKELGGIVTIHAGTKSNSIENITNSLPHAVAQKLDIASIIDIFELGKESDQKAYKEMVFPAIEKELPLIICSDNHNANKYIRKQKLWIKGSPNFEGLKYALNEPIERFFIGMQPDVLGRADKNKTKYLRNLSIYRSGKFEPKSIWFDQTEIPLNKELVVIIGHKGSGKSALGDILAMCLDAEHSEDYIFLNESKFRKKGLAERFSASVEFLNEEKTKERKLSHLSDGTQQRRIRYLPQSYFERVCNEVGSADEFRAEIEKVVFQYVPIEKRLGKSSFRDLIDVKKSLAERNIESIRNSISKLNENIIDLENLSTIEYKKKLSSKVELKETELRTHVKSKPEVVSNPAEKENSSDSSNASRLNALNKTKKAISQKIDELKVNISERSAMIVQLVELSADLKYKSNELKSVLDAGKDLAKKCDLDLSLVVRVEFDESIIKSKINELKQLNLRDEKELLADSDGTDSDTLAMKMGKVELEIGSVVSTLSNESKNYQEYLDNKAAWTNKRLSIVGDKEVPGSLEYLKEKIKYIEKEMENELLSLRIERVDEAINILKMKYEIQSFFDEVKIEIENSVDVTKVSGLSIASALHCSTKISENILKDILKNKASSFYGPGGNKVLQDELISPVDWSDLNSVRTFFTKFIEYLEMDHRPDNSMKKTCIADVTRDRKTLYDYLFGMEYIEPHYELQQDEKNLEQLSPGERGALLLIFYLVLDREDIPLIIDQPEDNLDNNSVARILVPYIQSAKKTRQIIMITHNPNLAVVSDAEQVIKVDIDKQNGNKFSYMSGGIENKSINEAILDVLEGTLPAFTERKDKYSLS